MKSIITVLLLAAVIIFETECCPLYPPEKVIEGWAGIPEYQKMKPFEYYYIKRNSKASVKAIEKRSGTLIAETCTNSTAQNGKEDFLRKMISDSLIYSDAGGTEISDSEYAMLNAVVADFSGKVKDLNIRQCRPLKQVQPDAPGIEWEECECIIYARVPGGKDAIVARAVEIERNRKK